MHECWVFAFLFVVCAFSKSSRLSVCLLANLCWHIFYMLYDLMMNERCHTCARKAKLCVFVLCWDENPDNVAYHLCQCFVGRLQHFAGCCLGWVGRHAGNSFVRMHMLSEGAIRNRARCWECGAWRMQICALLAKQRLKESLSWNRIRNEVFWRAQTINYACLSRVRGKRKENAQTHLKRINKTHDSRIGSRAMAALTAETNGERESFVVSICQVRNDCLVRIAPLWELVTKWHL